ncbi:MAG: YraN family protein [Myxococcales bacterium]|jgi:putative endonuclease|nr:YraN family protein [Myxococcales bacterium]MBL0192866.1 YraN family protein [Myxococcales bacterium]HQY60301.1 YraN family protein [Polyangiaceae bacterium]
MARAGKSLGRAAEDAASDHLVARGFLILGRNVRIGPLELDIVARDGALVALVEVRARREGALVGALASITPEKRRRLLRAAAGFLASPPVDLAGVTRVRIDVCIVHVSREGVKVEHLAGALTAD